MQAQGGEEFSKLQRRIDLAMEETTEQQKEIKQLTEQIKLLNQRLRLLQNPPTSNDSSAPTLAETDNKLLGLSIQEKTSLLQAWLETAQRWEEMFNALMQENDQLRRQLAMQSPVSPASPK